MKFLLVLLIPFVFSCGVKILLPYEEEQLCKRGPGMGVCGSVSDVYEDSIKNYKSYIRKER